MSAQEAVATWLTLNAAMLDGCDCRTPGQLRAFVEQAIGMASFHPDYDRVGVWIADVDLSAAVPDIGALEGVDWPRMLSAMRKWARLGTQQPDYGDGVPWDCKPIPDNEMTPADMIAGDWVMIDRDVEAEFRRAVEQLRGAP